MNGSQVSKLKRKAKCEELDINPGEPCKFGSHSFTNSEGNKGRCSACPLPFSLPSSLFPSQVLTESLKIFTQKGRPQSTTQEFVSVTYPLPIPGKAGSIHLPSLITNTTDRSEVYVYDICVCM